MSLPGQEVFSVNAEPRIVYVPVTVSPWWTVYDGRTTRSSRSPIRSAMYRCPRLFGWNDEFLSVTATPLIAGTSVHSS